MVEWLWVRIPLHQSLDLFLLIPKTFLQNYADDNALSASSTDVASLLELLSQESNTTTDWLISNHMIVNPKKFQIIVIMKRNLQNNPASLSTNKKAERLSGTS